MKRKLIIPALAVAAVLLPGCASKMPIAVEPAPTAEEVQEFTESGTPIISGSKYDKIERIETPESDCFSEIGYKDGTLLVTFRSSGASYVYLDVPKSVWDDLRDAYSKGGYYNEEIKGRYTCEKLS